MKNKKCGNWFKKAEQLAFEYASGMIFNQPAKYKVKTKLAVYKHKTNLEKQTEPSYSLRKWFHVFGYHLVVVRLYGIEFRPFRCELYGRCWFFFKDVRKKRK